MNQTPAISFKPDVKAGAIVVNDVCNHISTRGRGEAEVVGATVDAFNIGRESFTLSHLYDQTQQQGLSAYVSADQSGSLTRPVVLPAHEVQELSPIHGYVTPPNLRGGLIVAPSFGAEINNAGAFPTQHRGAVSSQLQAASRSFLFQILHEAHHSFFKFYHSIFLTSISNISTTTKGCFGNAGNQTNKFRNKFGVLRNETV